MNENQAYLLERISCVQDRFLGPFKICCETKGSLKDFFNTKLVSVKFNPTLGKFQSLITSTYLGS